ncbi:cytochrome P450 [Sordaria brevicollis]|uniref:Cytochrome P450 n=1 Tax=Sordaria brevicollis TaxID=83679 RepID=A0AAE0U0I1_SORBR|nr:cytochrome P450 [Sordaria brevicollis]
MALLSLGFGNLVVLGIASAFLYIFGYAIYNLYFHPLAKYPGPLLMRATRLGYCQRLLKGTMPFDVLELHKQYGDVVRVAPNELAFADPQAWKDIMGHRTGGEFEKWDKFYRPVEGVPTDIVNAGREEHGLLRRTMAHGFSDRSMRDQQPLIKGYIDLLMRRLTENCDDGKKTVDLAAWYNFTTFDVIGDLAFGEGFGCLEKSEYHPWVKNLFKMASAGTIFQIMSHYPALMKLMLALAPKSLMEEHEKHTENAKDKLRRRMEMGQDRADLVEGLLKRKDEWGLTIDKLQANSAILIIGGSETTATLLAGATFLLATNPAALKKLTEEIRSAFESEDEIDYASVSVLPYLLACLDEALRMYPPVPTGLPRVVPKGGASIAGHFIPEDSVVAIHQWAMYHNEKHFKDPFSFHPERWLNDPTFGDDRKEAFQPFHLGSRNCLGKNLAYLEMRIILARLLWNFDLKIAADSVDWMEKQKIFNFWDKDALNVYLTPRKF